MSVMGMEGNSHTDYDGTAMPTDAMHDDDVVEIARGVVNRGEGIIQMLSQIAHYGNRPLTEKVARMAKGSGARVLHAALIPQDQTPEMTDADIVWIEAMRSEGLDISAGTLMNRGWVEGGIRELDTAAGQLLGVREIVATKSDEDLLALLADPAFIKRFSDEYASTGAVNGAGGIETQVLITVGDHPELQSLVGRSIGEIAAESNRTPVEVLCDLGVTSRLKVQFKSGLWAASNPALSRKLLSSPGIAAGVSDAGAHTKAFANGQYGTELLIWLVRQEKVFSLEEMHNQLSLKVARTILLQDRGGILPGFWADILIYDLDALYYERDCYAIANDMPNGDWRRNAKAGGYSRILVNGVTTHIDDKATGAVPGQFVRITKDLGATMALAAE
jgi:N-acyl-D-aspartate/D-glutamate deacylase